MIGGTIAGVFNVAQEEVDRMKKTSSKGTQDELVQLVQNQCTANNNYQTPMQWSTNSSDYSTAKKTDGNSPEDDLLANIGLGNNNGARDGDGDGPGGNGGHNDIDERGGEGNGYKRNEFILVNPRNVTITPFSRRNINTNPYMPFNDFTRRLILPQGSDGEMLLRMLDTAEKRGGNKYDILQNIISKYPKAAEFDTAIKSALLNLTIGVAINMIKYSVYNGFDAWRKLYHRYVPLAEDLQNTFIQELMCLKPATETDIDSLFNEVERITDLYVKICPTDELSGKWIRAAAMKNLFEKILTSLTMEIKKAPTIDGIQPAINTYMHDHRIGFPRGTPGPMICLAEKEDTEAKTEAGRTDKPKEGEGKTTLPDNTVNAAKGNKKGDGSQRKGYGQCWESGEMGHPRRECQVFLERMGKGLQQDSIVAALKGIGKLGKGGKGKGKGGKGKGHYGGKGNKGYRAPGKAVGKGLNHSGEDDYAAAWGNEDYYHYNYGGGEWEHGHGEINYIGNQMMRLDQGKMKPVTATINSNTFTIITGKRDPLRGSE